MEASYEGYFENERFIPFGNVDDVNIPDYRKVFVTVYDEEIPYSPEEIGTSED